MWSIECKRIDRSQYSKDERDQFWRLWRHAMPRLEAYQPNLYFDFNFRCELKDVPDDYIDKLAERLVRRSEPIDIEDEWASGKVRALDLSLLQRVLETDVVMKASPRLCQLLVGSYDPLVAHAATMKCKLWHENGRYIDQIDFASVASWRCSAPASINAKARYFLRQIADANEQLEGFGPGVIHVGLEAMEGSDIEIARRPRILKMVRDFQPRGTDLRWLYLHYFIPDAPPTGGWKMDETTDWFAIKKPPGPSPRRSLHIVVPDGSETVPHPWERG